MATRRIETPAQLRTAIAKLSPASPLTDNFSARWRALRASGSGADIHNRPQDQRERKEVWYHTQHEHWLGWLKAYEGPGGYGRKDWSRSAEFVYNHIVNPQMLIYVAEAAGIDRDRLESATKAALASRATMSAMSAAIRRIVPWNMLEVALLAKG